MSKLLKFPAVIGDGRIDIFLKLLSLAKTPSARKKTIRLDWSKSQEISPAGFAILSTLFDCLIEQKIEVKNINQSKKFRDIPVVQNFKNITSFAALPKPDIHNMETPTLVMRGADGKIEPLFSECLDNKFSGKLSDDLLYAGRLILNELMQNSVDHSTAERYYIYAGLWKKEFHIGLLDMGITIPAKLEQKYRCTDDLGYLELSLQKGSSTRRQRTGGFGLYYFFELIKENWGRLTLVSRHAQLRRYFKTRKSQKNILKYPLPGTWCFARFPLEER